ncbi:MAG: DMT family transporter [Spirochaetes bacterium]|nr:DMT family transporter [Spirochaetota bacterium]
MVKRKHGHVSAILLAVLVTVLWSSSFVLIKTGLKHMPVLLFAGLRYFIAFIVLLPFVVFSPERMRAVRALGTREWLRVLTLGVLFYTCTQGASFIGLSLLPAVTVSLLLSFTPFIVVFSGMALLSERPTVMKWLGILLFAAGLFVYFFPLQARGGSLLGLVVVLFGVLVNAGSSVLGRSINREKRIPPLIVTVLSMGFGSLLLLISGIVTNGPPSFRLQDWVIILLLAVVNTAFAFTIWNHTLRTLQALESSIINNTMLFQVAVLAWVFLGEALSVKQVAGIAVSGAGAVLVQLRSVRRRSRDERSGI